MVNSCSAFGCKSGYKGHETDVKITFHSYPLANKDLCDKWIKANPRKAFVPSKHSKLCSLHFQPSDFIDERTKDSNASRRRRKTVALGEKLSHRYLKDDAVPSIFPNAPKYLSASGSGPRRTVSATASSRFEREVDQLNVLEQSFLDADDISSLSLDEVLVKLKAEAALPSGFSFNTVDSMLLIYWLQVQDSIPRVKACITLQVDFAVTVSLDGKSVEASDFADLFKGPVRHLSEVVNLMARVKSWAEDVQSIPLKMSIQMARWSSEQRSAITAKNHSSKPTIWNGQNSTSR
jgi:hypothetical protein